jgi:hypothetical protein
MMANARIKRVGQQEVITSFVVFLMLERASYVKGIVPLQYKY